MASLEVRYDMSSGEQKMMINYRSCPPSSDWFSSCAMAKVEPYSSHISPKTSCLSFVVSFDDSDIFLFVMDSPVSSENSTQHQALEVNSVEVRSFLLQLKTDKSVGSQLPSAYKRDMAVHPIPSKATLHYELCNFEKKFSLLPTNMCIAVLYVRKGQTEPDQWFRNGRKKDPLPLDKQFHQFLNALGSKINLKNWEGFRGGLSDDQTAYYMHWKGRVPTIFHVAPFLGSQAHRGIIGNDVSVIAYVEEGGSFSKSNCTKLGRVPQNWCIIQPVKEDLYRHSFFVNESLPNDFGPSPPSDPIDLKMSAEVILTKCFNTQAKQRTDGPLSYLFRGPRKIALEAIAARYLPTKNKKQATRYRSESPRAGNRLGDEAPPRKPRQTESLPITRTNRFDHRNDASPTRISPTPPRRSSTNVSPSRGRLSPKPRMHSSDGSISSYSDQEIQFPEVA